MLYYLALAGAMRAVVCCRLSSLVGLGILCVDFRWLLFGGFDTWTCANCLQLTGLAVVHFGPLVLWADTFWVWFCYDCVFV